jgi:hypothetical protein
MTHHTHRHGLVALFAAVAICGCAARPPLISEADLLGYASREYDKALYTEGRIVLGRLHGTNVVADFICSDLCPASTVRIVHFEVEPGPSCAEIGGVERLVMVPVAIAVMERAFCFPKVLADHWDAYLR